jgi:hypothetical protein
MRVGRDHPLRDAPRSPRDLARGAEQRDAGVPIAAAMCIGAESTPDEGARGGGQRDQFGQRQLPVRSTTRVPRVAGRTAASTAATSARSRSSGAPVRTTANPSATMRSSSAAVRSAGQHLKSQREPGCTWTKSLGASPCCGEQRRDAALRRRAGHQHEAACRRRRGRRRCGAARPGSASTVWRSVRGGLPVEVREVAPPQRAARLALARDRPARTQEAGERQPARVLGQVHQQIVARARSGAAAPFAPSWVSDALLLPVAVDRVQLGDGGMARPASAAVSR